MSVVDDGGEVLKMPSPVGMRMRSLKVPAEALCERLPAAAAAAAGVDDPAAGAAVRVKLVISKQELKKMLDKEGMSLDDMVSLMRKEASGREQEEEFCCGGWRPALESIPEGSDL